MENRHVFKILSDKSCVLETILTIFFSTDGENKKAKGCSIKSVQSVKIPAGFKLYLFDDSDETRLTGPFTGPLEVANLGTEGMTTISHFFIRARG